MLQHSGKFGIHAMHTAVVLCIACASNALAQQAQNEITITAESPVRLTGFDDVAQHNLPLNTTTINRSTLDDIGAHRVSDALRLDASVSDSYNLPVYWDKLSVRGFALSNQDNYRREGLRISAETIIPMENKERVELLKGTSGIQAGTSAPGGLVNYVVKRAPASADKPIRDLTFGYGVGNNRLAAADLGGRFGDAAVFGYRLNIAHEDLDPYIRNTQGHRDLIALALDWRFSPGTTLDWEIEQSHHEQIGVNFYSLLASDGPQNPNRVITLPSPTDGTRNITRQPGSLPGVFDGLTSSMRLKHLLNQGWIWTTQIGIQRLRADDRLTYASGCGVNQKDSFCLSPKGDFQIHDYRSENEHRNTDTIRTDLEGQMHMIGFEHNLKLSLARHRQLNQMPATTADTLLGSTNSMTGGLTPVTGSTNYWINTNNNDHSTAATLNDRIRLTQRITAWIGLRHTDLVRQSVQTNGTNAVRDARGISTSWFALSQQFNNRYAIYASVGQGLEAETAPTQPHYINAGQPLPALRSKQHEVGLKYQEAQTTWQATWFHITRPATADATVACNNSADPPCTYNRQIDGQAHHQGLELNGQTKRGLWNLSGSLMWLDAQREKASVLANLNGQRPINVPPYILRGMTEYRFASISGLRTGLRLSHEGERYVTEHGDIKLPAWTTLDATTHYETQVNNVPTSWTLAIQNLANKHYWRESPKAYGQYFLYPGAPRTLRATVAFHL